jgi:nucleotide-binding universal stress UspA family protein
MKRIIVAVDGSEASLHGARTALEIAKATKGEVTLVYVVSQPFLPTEVPFAVGQFAEDAVKIGELMLEQTAQSLGEPGLRRVCLTGPAAEVLADLAESENADLIVVGSKGRGAVSRVLVGSTTDRVVHISKRPVLVVR